MKVEHIGLNVAQSTAMAEWYCDNLGMKVVRKLSATTFFIADESGHGIFEIYQNPAAEVPDYAAMDPLILHIAFQTEDIDGDFKRLVAAGATVVAEPADKGGSVLAMLRDPWGIAIQLAARPEPLI